MAQRAYRQRKENTIDALQRQVHALQETIAQMNKSFHDFSHKLLHSTQLANSPQLARRLRTAAQHIALLSRSSQSSGTPGSSDSHSMPECRDSDSGSLSPEYSSPHDEDPQSVPRQPTLYPRPRQVQIGLGYVQLLDESSSANEAYSPAAPVHPATTDGEATTIVDDDSYMAQIDPPPSKSTSPGYAEIAASSSSSVLDTISPRTPYTYSTQEVTFARRLHRAALESAFHLLATAYQRPAAYSRVFRLSPLYHNRESLMARFRHMLTRQVDEPLEFLHAPLIHLGGAGNHYATGRIPNASVAKSGPAAQKVILQHSGIGSDDGISLDLDPDEYEGEWFDSHDVEGYLLDLGIPINPRSTFAEVRVPNTGPLMKLLKQSGDVSIPLAPLPSPSPPPSWPLSQSTSLSSNMNLDMIGDNTTHLFPELGLGDASSFSWSTDMNNASNWFMGAGDRTPNFLASGSTALQLPSSWDMSDSLAAALGGASQKSQAEPEFSRMITLDVANFIDGKFQSKNVLHMSLFQAKMFFWCCFV
jgi:hypothetical protein